MGVAESQGAESGISPGSADVTESLSRPDIDAAYARFLTLPRYHIRLLTACAGLGRLRRLLAACFGGSRTAVRLNGDEFIYQTLYQGFERILSQDPLLIEALRLARQCLPANLEVAQHAVEQDGRSYWTEHLNPGLRALETELVRLCVLERLKSNDPGTKRLFVKHDQYIENASEQAATLNAQARRSDVTVLRQPVLDLSNRKVLRRPPLNEVVWKRFRGQELEGALAALERIYRYWDGCFASSCFFAVRENDQALYIILYHDLFFMLEQRRDLNTVSRQLMELVPSAEVLYPEELALHDYVSEEIFGNLIRARHILQTSLIAAGRVPGPSAVDTYFELFDAELEWHAELMKAAVESFAGQLGLPSTNAGTNELRKQGRPRKEIPYSVAQAAYWQVFEGLESAGEHRKPSNQEVCDYLAAQGVSIGKTRFGQLTKEWRILGLDWPPPVPDPGH